jgi:endonuclease YncB( thermonuclease family)
MPLPIRRPRRIFRSGSLGSGSSVRLLNPTLLAGLLGAGAGAAVMMFSLPAALFGRVPQPSGTLSADAPQVAVVDGETLRLRDTVVHLQGVAAPSRGQACRAPDGTGYDCGAASTEALAALVRGHAVACRLSGRDHAGFPEGRCDAAGSDVNRALVATGWARARPDMPDLAGDETAAQAQHLGLWRTGGQTAPF